MYDAKDLLHLLIEGNPNHAYLTVAQMLDYFSLINFPNFNVLKTKQYVKLTPVCIYFRKHSCLLKPFNYHINSLISGGLFDFWASKFRLRFPRKIDQSEPKPLSIHQIGGVLTVCVYSIITSVVLLILEIISPDYKAIKTILDFLTFNVNKKRKFFAAK